MGRYQITAPDGRIITVEGPAPPSQADAEGIFAKLPKKPYKPGVIESFIGRGIETLGGVANLALEAGKAAVGGPLEQAKFLPKLASGIYEGAVDTGAAAIARQFPGGFDNQPETPEFYGNVAKAGAAAVPFVGPYVLNKFNDIAEGQGRKVIGETAFDLAAAFAGPKAPPAGAAIASAGKTAITKAGPVLKTVMEDRILGPAGGAMVGGAVAGPAGAAVGGGVGAIYAAAKKLEKNAVKATARAEKTAAKLEEVLQKQRDDFAMEQAKLSRDQTYAEIAREEAAQAQRNAAALDRIKQARAQTAAEIAREEATAKATQQASVAGAKAEIAIVEPAERAAAAAAKAVDRDAAKLTEARAKAARALETGADLEAVDSALAEVRIIEMDQAARAKTAKGTKTVPVVAESPQSSPLDAFNKPQTVAQDAAPAAEVAAKAIDPASKLRRLVKKLHAKGRPTADIVDAAAGIPEIGWKQAGEAVSFVMDELELSDIPAPKSRQNVVKALKASVKAAKKPKP